MTEIYDLIKRYEDELNAIEKAMNTSGNTAKSIGKCIPYHFHNTLEQNFFRMVVSFINEVEESENLFTDLRNEETHRLCKKIYRLMKENGDDLKYVSIPMV